MKMICQENCICLQPEDICIRLTGNRFREMLHEALRNWIRKLQISKKILSAPKPARQTSKKILSVTEPAGQTAGISGLTCVRKQPDPEEINDSAGRILDTYGNALLRLAYSYLHNMADAEDVLQDTLVRYLQAAPEFESTEHEKAWLLRVAANISKNRIDYNKIRESDELDETFAQEEREDLDFVWDAVKELPENYREVIHLFYQEGYQTREIARILGRKESSIRSDLKRGREKLKTILKEAYDFE